MTLFTLPFNLRDPNESGTLSVRVYQLYSLNYHLQRATLINPDSTVREFFLKSASDYVASRIRYIQFFKHILSAIADELDRMASSTM